MESKFLNILKSPQDSQMQLEENSLNLSEIADVNENAFEIENSQEDIEPEEFEVSQNITFIETPSIKRIKRQRGNKKDDFDYNKFIKEELSQYRIQNMSKKEIKRLIQKIRNRKSAQRSRLRQKQAMNYLEQENMNLKDENKDLQTRIKRLEKELKTQKAQILNCKVIEPSCNSFKKNSDSTENETESQKFSQFNSPQYKRNNIQQQGFLQTKPMLFMLGLLLIFCLFQQREPQYNNTVKMGGFSYLSSIKSKLNFRKRLQEMRKYQQEKSRSRSRTDQEEEYQSIQKKNNEIRTKKQYQPNVQYIKKQNGRFKNLKKIVDNCLSEEGPKINMCEQEM